MRLLCEDEWSSASTAQYRIHSRTHASVLRSVCLSPTLLSVVLVADGAVARPDDKSSRT